MHARLLTFPVPCVAALNGVRSLWHTREEAQGPGSTPLPVA
jgi:hypothetical protein